MRTLTLKRHNHRVILDVGNGSLTEGVLTPLLRLDGGSIILPVLTSNRESFSMTVEAYDRTCLPWLEKLFGLEVGNVVNDMLMVPDSVDVIPRTFHWEDLPEAIEETLHVLARWMQGLWMRRYWPAGKKGDVDIPALNIALIELELVALARHSKLWNLLSETTLLDYIAAPVVDAALELTGAIDVISIGAERSQDIRLLTASILHDFLETIHSDDTGGKDEQAYLGVLDDYVKNERLKALPGQRSATSLLPTEAQLSEFFEMPTLPEQETRDLALVAGAQAEPYGKITDGSDIIDWRLNKQGLLDCGCPLQWSCEQCDGGWQLSVEVIPYTIPRNLESPTVAVYLQEELFPYTSPLTLNEWNEFAATITVPSNAIEVVDVRSTTNHHRTLFGSERKQLEFDQKLALAWATCRIQNAARCPVPTTTWDLSDTLKRPWLAEIIATCDAKSFIHATDRFLGLISE